jgi:Asp-tRNA(Asn)/Glu-tRNA(Gln) amidotransferase A subunit family amidase
MPGQILTMGAAEIAREIRRGRITPLEVVEAYIARIEQVNPAINALVTPMFDQAREEAHWAGERLAGGPADLPPLFGVPVTVKDALPVAGARFTAGSIHQRDNVAADDAEAVRRLRRAGAIILGKTNCAELSGSTETDNPVFGLTRNPWNLARSAGGSTGGEAALIAAGGSPLGLGSDIAGSLRIPAAFCGITCLKPTAWRIPTDGHVPKTPESIGGWNTVGPLARRVEDLALALEVLSATPTADWRAVKLDERRVLVPEFLSLAPVDREVTRAVRAASEALSGSGLRVTENVRLPLLTAALAFSATMHREWLPRFRRYLGGGEAVRLIPELIAALRGRGQLSPATLPLLATVETLGPALRLLGYGRDEVLDRIRGGILAAMGPGGVLVWPVFPTLAPKHGFAWRPNSSPVYTCIFNALGFPSVVVPLGPSAENLPLAVQIVARPEEDEVALAVAALLEREFSGALAPAGLDPQVWA